jgi:hypothetical protein
MNINPVTLLQDKEVRLVEEPDNQHDRDAIAIYYQDIKLGFIPKGLATVVGKKGLRQHNVKAYVTRINGTKERPNVMVLVQVR